MLLMVRLICKEDPEGVWDCVIDNLKGKETKKVKPLYISQLLGKNYVSIIFDVEKIDYIVKFLVEAIAKIAECEKIADTQTLTLMKPVFLPIPKERPESLCRVSIFLKVEPRYYHEVYNELLDYRYEPDLFPTYISYSLGDFDIIMSMLVEDMAKLKAFVDEKLRKLNGVNECTVNQIKKSELLANRDTWRRLQRSLLHIPPWATKEIKKHFLYDYDLSIEDYCKLTGAMIDEL